MSILKGVKGVAEKVGKGFNAGLDAVVAKAESLDEILTVKKTLDEKNARYASISAIVIERLVDSTYSLPEIGEELQELRNLKQEIKTLEEECNKDKYKRCTSCGEFIEKDFDFCSRCGANQQSDDDSE